MNKPGDVIGGSRGPHTWFEFTTAPDRRQHYFCSCGARKVGALVGECNVSLELDESDRAWLSTGTGLPLGSCEVSSDPVGHDDATVRDRERFLNRLRILRSLDHVDMMSQLKEWMDFRDDPYEYVISCSDEEAAVIWTALRKREA